MGSNASGQEHHLPFHTPCSSKSQPMTGLKAVVATLLDNGSVYTILIIRNLIDIDLARFSILIPFTQVPAQVSLPYDLQGEQGRGGKQRQHRCGATITFFTLIGFLLSSPSIFSVFKTLINCSPSPYLKVTRLHFTQRGMRSTSSCSTLTHSTGLSPLEFKNCPALKRALW
jgi:hypothetical protein